MLHHHIMIQAKTGAVLLKNRGQCSFKSKGIKQDESGEEGSDARLEGVDRGMEGGV